MKSKLFIIYYFIVLTIEIFAELLFSYTNNPNLVFVTKPLLMPILIVWAFFSSTADSIHFNKTLISALVFSMFGDVALMFLPFEPKIFIVGLVFFLMAHIVYISLFLKAPFQNKTSYFKQNPLVLIPCVCYVLTLIAFLYKQNHPEFIKMQVPVIIYAVIILLMLISAISIYQKRINGMMNIIIGALLFVFSDSTIALSKFSTVFVEQQNIARIIIMSLYGIAQFMIVKGVLLSTISHQENIKNKLSEEST